jgi:endonuclease-3
MQQSCEGEEFKVAELLTKAEVEKVLEYLERCYPDPRTALRHDNPFELLVATILSAQTTDKQVNRVTAELFADNPSPRDLLDLGTDGLEEEFRSLGLFRTKARYVAATCRKLIEDFAGTVPETREELMMLPGVGRKTANVVLSNAFEQPAFAVDTHVFRVANRLGIVCAEDTESAEEQLTKRIPRELWIPAHHWLIFHGRNTCKAQNPQCGTCELSSYCRFFHRQQSAD